MWRTAFGLLLAAHGALLVLIWLPRPSAEARMDTSRSWLLGEARLVSLVLALVAGVLVAASGLALLLHQAWWSLPGLAGGVLSLTLLGLFFSPWWLVATAISAGLTVTALWDRTSG